MRCLLRDLGLDYALAWPGPSILMRANRQRRSGGASVVTPVRRSRPGHTRRNSRSLDENRARSESSWVLAATHAHSREPTRTHRPHGMCAPLRLHRRWDSAHFPRRSRLLRSPCFIALKQRRPESRVDAEYILFGPMLARSSKTFLPRFRQGLPIWPDRNRRILVCHPSIPPS